MTTAGSPDLMRRRPVASVGPVVPALPTTNTVQFSVALADSLLRRREPRALRTDHIMLAFLVGVGGGAVSFSSVGFLFLLGSDTRPDGNGRLVAVDANRTRQPIGGGGSGHAL